MSLFSENISKKKGCLAIETASPLVS